MQFLYIFVIEFYKILFIFLYFKSVFFLNLNLFYFFSLLKINIFLVFSNYFDALISKIIFKNKKTLF
jgi:hypothetical protein